MLDVTMAEYVVVVVVRRDRERLSPDRRAETTE
jgi:hypothetical protein